MNKVLGSTNKGKESECFTRSVATFKGLRVTTCESVRRTASESVEGGAGARAAVQWLARGVDTRAGSGRARAARGGYDAARGRDARATAPAAPVHRRRASVTHMLARASR